MTTLNDLKVIVLANSTGKTGTLNDLEKEFWTISLNAGGALTLPLLAADGTEALPSYSFSTDPDTGLYLVGNDDMRLSVGADDKVKYTATDMTLDASHVLSWGSADVATPDVKLQRDAASALAQRDGTNAQTYNLYNTFTDASNYERLGIKYATNVITFASEAAGTGTARDFQFTGGSVLIDQNLDSKSLTIDSEATTSNVFEFAVPKTTTGNVISAENANSLTSGRVAAFHSNSADASARDVIKVTNDNVAAVGATCLNLRQDAANQVMILDQNQASSFVDYQGTAAATVTDPISTNTTSGATTHHIQVEINGAKAWIAVSTTNPS